MEDARIEWPSRERMQEFAERISAYEPAVRNVCLFLDGTEIMVQEPTIAERQNPLYSGKSKNVVVNNILVFAPDGCIAHARMNYPGSYHDVRAMGDLRENLLTEEWLPRPFSIIADSAFPHTGEFEGRIITPLKTDELERINVADINDRRRYELSVKRVRVAVEWGNAGLKKVWRQLSLKLPFDEVYRSEILTAVVFLHNFRVRTTALSQIATVYEDSVEY